MKKIILSLFFCTICLLAFAQSGITVTPNPVEVEVSAAEDDVEAHNFINNGTAGEVQLRWVRISEDMPAEWESWVCDNNLCYGPSTNETPSNRPVIIAGNQNGIMIMHVDPNNVPGVGTIMLEITDFNDHSIVIDTAIYIFNAMTVSTSELEQEVESLSIFPNPTTDYIQLSNNTIVDQVVIYNVLGKRMLDYRYEPGRHYDVAGLPAGFYLVSLVNREEGILKTLRLQKQ